MRQHEKSGVIKEEYKSLGPLVYPSESSVLEDAPKSQPMVTGVRSKRMVKFEEPQHPRRTVERCKEFNSGRRGIYPVIRTKMAECNIPIPPDPCVTAPLFKPPPGGMVPGLGNRQLLERITERESSEPVATSSTVDELHGPLGLPNGREALKAGLKAFRAGGSFTSRHNVKSPRQTSLDHNIDDDPGAVAKVKLENIPALSKHKIDDDISTLVNSTLNKTHSLAADPKVPEPSGKNFRRRKEA